MLLRLSYAHLINFSPQPYGRIVVCQLCIYCGCGVEQTLCHRGLTVPAFRLCAAQGLQSSKP